MEGEALNFPRFSALSPADIGGNYWIDVATFGLATSFR
jgi:hypothetical protein